MARYDSHKFPLQSMMNQWVRNRTNNVMEKMAKSIPCHIQEVTKDFVKVAFETANGIFTPPVVKIPQQFSQFAREPTQKGDKGYGVPGHYYLGGVTGDAGGSTNFFPRGNLTTLAFNPVSHTQNRDRDYDTLYHQGGPNGWSVTAFSEMPGNQNQQGGGGSGGGGGTPANAARMSAERGRNMNVQRSVMGIGVQPFDAAAGGGSGSGSGSGGGGGQQQQQQPEDKTTFSFDKDSKSLMQSKDEKHNVTVDAKAKKITLNLPVGEWGYAGGDGEQGKYAPLVTTKGPVVNFKGRIG